MSRWDDLADRWPGRAERLGRMIYPETDVLDLGAGAGGLQAHLPRRVRYTGVDLPEFDMNEDRWPTGRWDVAVMSGVLEYAHDPATAFLRLRKLAPRALVTYVHGGRRRDPDWNDLDEVEFARLARRAGWRVRIAGEWKAPGVRRQNIWELT